MKKSDVAIVILIAVISVVASFFVGRSIFGGVYEGSAKVKTIEAISASIEEPDPDIFNSSAINPAVKVTIEGSDDTNSINDAQAQ